MLLSSSSPTDFESCPTLVFLKFWSPVIFNSYIFQILLLFTWRKLNRPLTWSLNKPHQNIACPTKRILPHPTSGNYCYSQELWHYKLSFSRFEIQNYHTLNYLFIFCGCFLVLFIFFQKKPEIFSRCPILMFFSNRIIYLVTVL